MLTVINLYTIDKIFNEDAEIKLSTMAKMLYVNCLTHHFKGKTPTVSNAVAFDIFKNDIPNYMKYERVFEELHKAGLVVVGINAVSFVNCWGKHIDRSLLDKVSPQEYVAGFQFQTPEQFKDELLKNQTLYELTAMKHKISKRQLETLIELFVKEQTTFDKKYQNFADCIKHFTYWIPHNLDKTTKENIKSSSKLLGE
jgi:hypothetical protein